ncbi:MAG: hypothetical protein C5B51_17535 [Terriglobia bacterium]|nr:MAG: hypothetical protein C5B51_17535 [Terriglobia bacterium]
MSLHFHRANHAGRGLKHTREVERMVGWPYRVDPVIRLTRARDSDDKSIGMRFDTTERALHNRKSVFRRERSCEYIMCHKIVSALMTGIITLALTGGLVHARKGSANRSDKIVGQNMNVTGCLQKQEKEKNEYRITGEDGKTWGLKSTSVNLADHLNHTVTVSGKVTKEEHGQETGDVNVTSLKMISQSCQ